MIIVNFSAIIILCYRVVEFYYYYDFEDKEFENLDLLIALPRRQDIFKPRTDHFTRWRKGNLLIDFVS